MSQQAQKLNTEFTEHELYRLHFDYVLHESKAVWDTSQLFLVANTFLAAILGSIVSNNNCVQNFNSNFVFWLLSIMGLLISVLWLTSFERVRKHYHFRLEQAKEFENNFELFSGKAENLTGGGVVIIKGNPHDLKLLGLINLKSFSGLKIIIMAFILFYLVLIFRFLPWSIYIWS